MGSGAFTDLLARNRTRSQPHGDALLFFFCCVLMVCRSAGALILLMYAEKNKEHPFLALQMTSFVRFLQ
jgi:hypothetical protein